MAEIKWLPRARQELDERLAYARLEFGATTANRWADAIIEIEHRLRLMPESFTPEPLMKGCHPCFRYCVVMKRFKLLYFYSSSDDVVYFADIWDMRMNPEALRQRLV